MSFPQESSMLPSVGLVSIVFDLCMAIKFFVHFNGFLCLIVWERPYVPDYFVKVSYETFSECLNIPRCLVQFDSIDQVSRFMNLYSWYTTIELIFILPFFPL